MIGTNVVRVPPNFISCINGRSQGVPSYYIQICDFEDVEYQAISVFCDLISLAFNLVVRIVLKVTNNVRYICVEYALTN